jgi:AcrR family transcriptional regulator
MSDERPLTEKQAERRRRVLLAAIELAAEGGYDGVQMREVAERAGVAIGTVYHYFDSKDHLLAESMTEWLTGLEASIARRPARGDTTLERVLDILRRTTRGMAQNRQVSAAVIGGLVAEGPHGAASQQALHVMFSAMLRTAFEPDFPAERRDKIIRSLEHIWFSELIAWKNGWNPYEQSARELEDAAMLFLEDTA